MGTHPYALQAARLFSLRRFALAALAWSIAVPWPASAQTGRSDLTATIDRCVPIDHTEFQRLLSMELAAVLDQSSEPQPRLATVSLSCVADGVQLRLDDAITRKSMTRVISLANIPARARPRLIALAVVEFIAASWLELRLLGELPVEPAGPQPPDTAIRSATRMIEKWNPNTPASPAPTGSAQTLALGFDLAAFTSALRPIPCAALRFSNPIVARLAVSLGVQVGQTALPGGLGSGLERESVDVHVTTASLLVSLVYHDRIGDFDWSAGAGARIGFAYMEGAPPMTSTFRPDSSYLPWVGSGVVLGLDYRLTSHVRIVSGVEVGPVVFRAVAVAGGATVLELADVWGNVSLGLAWASH